MRRLSITLSLVAALVVVILGTDIGQGTAWAHEFKTDKGISAVLHISPDDNPLSGQKTLLYFAFSSDKPDFNLGYCKCAVSYQASDNRLKVIGITQDSEDPTSGYANVTFEKPGVYELMVRGQTGTDVTSTFTLKFPIRVVAGTSAAEAYDRRIASLQVLLLSITALVICGIIAANMIRQGRRYGKR